MADVPWCDSCQSYHVVPKDAAHKAALRCMADNSVAAKCAVCHLDWDHCTCGGPRVPPDSTEQARAIVRQWATESRESEWQVIGSGNDLIGRIAAALDERDKKLAVLAWITKRDGNLYLHENFCATSYDDDARCDCRITKVSAALERASKEKGNG